MSKIKIETIKPFGPSIAKVKIPENILNDINKYVDKIILDKKKSKNLDHGDKLAGNVTQEFILDKEFSTKSGWLDFLARATDTWIKESNHRISEFKLINTWVVRQFSNEYNPAHFHTGHISGAGFLKIPNTFGDTVQKNKKSNKNGKLQLIHGSRQFLCKSMYTITPEVGDFYFFPHYLMHIVYPFHGTNEERRSISFNANIDNQIFNNFA